MNEKCYKHEHSKYHQTSLKVADEFCCAMEHPQAGVLNLLDKKRMENIGRNREILKCIVEAILFCAKQCIALHGEIETTNICTNPGNFLSILKLMSKHNAILKSQLNSPAMKNATYMSPQTQNELLNVMGRHIVSQGIIEEIKQAKLYSIMADEVTSHNTEHLVICARFVNNENNVREEFMTFLKLERTTGEYVAEKMVTFLKSVDLPIENIRGQGYDGASSVSLERVDLQARIKEISPLATYIHCSSHQLNLVISHSYALPEVRNVIDRLRNCCHFFLASPKQNGLLEHIVSNKVEHKGTRKALPDLCKTRWAERHTAYQHFYQAYTFITEALELIGYRMHTQEYGDLYSDWDVHNRSEAQQILASITTFDFIIVFMSIYQYLSHLSGITVKLQNSALDIVDAYEMIEGIRSLYKLERQNVDNKFHNHSCRMVEKVGRSVSMPRIAARQQHRSNISSDCPLDYIKKNVAIPFIDHISTHLAEQFSSLTITAGSILGIVPSVMHSKEINLSRIVEVYHDDLPSPEHPKLELMRWKSKYSDVPYEKLPSLPSSAIKDCDAEIYPNIRILLQLACTIPVTSCECERSASALGRLNNYMRSSMGKERLSNLALLHIHYKQQINVESVMTCLHRFTQDEWKWNH